MKDNTLQLNLGNYHRHSYRKFQLWKYISSGHGPLALKRLKNLPHPYQKLKSGHNVFQLIIYKKIMQNLVFQDTINIY